MTGESLAQLAGVCAWLAATIGGIALFIASIVFFTWLGWLLLSGALTVPERNA